MKSNLYLLKIDYILILLIKSLVSLYMLIKVVFKFSQIRYMSYLNKFIFYIILELTVEFKMYSKYFRFYSIQIVCNL